jgi:acetate kinase
MGVEIDETTNTEGRGRISTRSSRVAVWVISTNEELMIARHTLRLLKTTQGELK